MLFNSFAFWGFFTVIFAIYFLLPQKYRWLSLLLASYFFYGYWKIEFILLLLFPTLVSYFCARAMAATSSRSRKKLFLWSGLLATLGLLFIFKYLLLFRQTLHDLAGYFFHVQPLATWKILLPIGISFYTFKILSYLIDVYYQRIPAERHLGIYALYVSFFPQLLAGPIDRAAQFIPQLKKPVVFDWQRAVSGFQLIVWGLFKKMVVADRLALFVNDAFRQPEGQGLQLVLAVYFYAFQIYCDFSGYSDIAMGITRILGFESMKNFDFPYFSRSITQFWSRWHISLSSWLRDYLFLPLAYAVMRRIKTEKLLSIKAETWGYFVGIFLTMLLGGLWHGASWNFVIWGGLYGVYQVFSYSGKRLRRKLAKRSGLQRLPWLRTFLGVFITFNLVSFAWIFFRSPSFAAAVAFLRHVSLSWPRSASVHAIFNITLLILFLILEFAYKNRDRLGFWLRWPIMIKTAIYALFCCLIVIFAVDTSNEFIYFQI
jgi:alginate O-acetyltransferase complex protein AlgI